MLIGRGNLIVMDVSRACLSEVRVRKGTGCQDINAIKGGHLVGTGSGTPAEEQLLRCRRAARRPATGKESEEK